MRRQARASGNFFVEPEPKLIVAVRIRGIIGVAPKTKKILRLLRLRQINNAVFIRVNGATMNMLRLVEPFVAYGYASLKTVRTLLYKRGYAKFQGERKALDNDLIEKALGEKGIVCMEDLVHEIYTVGPNFKHANKFLWPFKLNSPRGGMRGKVIHYIEGGSAGNRGALINKLIKRMN